MSVQGLQTSFDRLSILKTPMNWRGDWVSGSNYLLNDVVISPTNSGSYILTGAVALLSTVDPISSADWTEVSGTSVGVDSITAGAGIIVNNLIPRNPVISNDGILTVEGSTNITVDNTDPHNPIISSTAVGTLVQGTGISINNSDPINPVISNAGVTSLTAGGAGVQVSSATGDITVTNSGLRSLTAGSGISLNSSTGDVKVTNAGVISVSAGDGIQIIGTTSPQINNTGVLSIAPADGTITVGGTQQDVILSATVSRLSYLYLSGNFVIGSGGTIAPGGSGSLIYTQPAAANLVTTLMLNGDPDHPNAVFLFDLTSVYLSFNTATTILNNSFIISFIDTTVTPTKTYIADVPNGALFIPTAITGVSFPLTVNVGTCYLNIAAARTAGVNVISAIQITNNTASSMNILGSNSVLAQYFPNGLE